MGDKFSWDRLLKRNKDTEVDNTIEINQEQPAGPVAPLRAVQPPQPIRVNAAPEPPINGQNIQQAAHRAPLVIEWDEFEKGEPQSAVNAPPTTVHQQISVPPVAPPAIATTEEPALQPIQSPTENNTDNFWARLNQDTQAALGQASATTLNSAPVTTGWQEVELAQTAQAPTTPTLRDSDFMAGTMDPENYQPIASTYQRPSEEEIRKKTDEIAKSSAWEDQAVSEDVPFQLPQTEAVLQPTNLIAPPPVFPTTPPQSQEILAESESTNISAQIVEPPKVVQVPTSLEPVTPQNNSFDVPTTEISSTPELPPVLGDDFGGQKEFFQPLDEAQPQPVEELPPVYTGWLDEPSLPAPSVCEPFNQVIEELPEIEPIQNDEGPQSLVTQKSSVELPPVQEISHASHHPEPNYSWEIDHETEVPTTESEIKPIAIPQTESEAVSTPANFWASIPGGTVNPPTEVAQTPVEVVEPAAVPPEYSIIEEHEAPQQVEKDIRIGDVLLKHKLVAPAQLERALARQADSNEKLGQVLISMGLISERRLLQVLASQKGVSPWHLEDDAPSQDALGLVSHETCQLFQVLPVAIRGDLLLLAMREPSDNEAIEAIRSASGKRIEPVLADEARLSYTIDRAYGVVRERHVSTVEEMVAIAQEQEVNLSDGTVINPERPDHLSALLRELIQDARRKHATSITIGEKSDGGEVLYRIHGRLCPVQKIPYALAKSILTHAQGDLEQEQYPFGIEPTSKVAITTGQSGNQFVVTFPQPERGLVPLGDLGIESENLKLLREITERPYGLFLITGSARSSKDVTIGALAKEMELQGRVVSFANHGENIAEQIGLAVTSESEVIVVGELDRDEDIKAAVKAASSGHLILAEVTANDAPTAIQQLISCGADPYLLATILTGVWCQAVAPKLCLSCRTGIELTEVQREILDQYGMRHIQKVFESSGCNACNHTSVSGQIVLSEILPVSSDVSHLITEKAPVEKIAEQAGFAGYLPMDFDAMTRIIHGDVDFATAKKLVFFKQREIAPISRRDTWETQAS